MYILFFKFTYGTLITASFPFKIAEVNLIAEVLESIIAAYSD